MPTTLPIDAQHRLVGELALKLIDQLEARGIDRTLIADGLVTAGIAVVTEALGVDPLIERLEKLTADMEYRRSDFPPPGGPEGLN